MFKSLKRIIYKAFDISEARNWYTELLGYQPVLDTPFLVIFKIEDCTLSLAKSSTISPINVEGSETYWEVDDIETSFQKLIDSGGKVHTPIREVLNIRIAKVIDPFGNIICITGSRQDEQERTIEKKPSETAMLAAFARAVAAKEDRMKIKGPDYLAELFVTDEAKKAMSDIDSRRWTIQNLITHPLYAYFLCRTAYIDSVFERAVTESFPQVVILGAGYDTRAIRFKSAISNMRIFEMDAALTQNRKIETLKNADIEIPGYLSFISINFNDEEFASKLMESGFDKLSKTLFIWEGVTFYLQEKVIRETLSSIKAITPANTLICFDYMTSKVDSVYNSEPFLFWITSAELPAFMSALGFQVIEHIQPDEMEKRYLLLENEVLAEKTLPFFSMATAAVAGR